MLNLSYCTHTLQTVALQQVSYVSYVILQSLDVSNKSLIVDEFLLRPKEHIHRLIRLLEEFSSLVPVHKSSYINIITKGNTQFKLSFIRQIKSDLLQHWCTKTTTVTPRRGPCESRQICRRHPLSLHHFIANAEQEKYLTLKMKVNNSNLAASKNIFYLCKSHSTHFCASFQRFRYIKFKNVDLENLGQGYELPQWGHSILQISKSIKVTIRILALALTIAEILNQCP